ncbi:MAG: phytanoyl-CoA dioxygenase, partial [Sphingobacteriales bacterium]
MLQSHATQLANDGYTTIPGVFSDEACNAILQCIDVAAKDKSTFRKSADLFAIRQFLNELPETQQLILNAALKSLINALFGPGYFVSKSIYFDKPAGSNWFVAYHQDLTISVDQKIELPGFGPWSVKQDQYAVQPPLDILEDNFTIRIHLDDTDQGNGALKVVPGSHSKAVYRPETIDWKEEPEHICPVPRGGVMI